MPEEITPDTTTADVSATDADATTEPTELVQPEKVIVEYRRKDGALFSLPAYANQLAKGCLPEDFEPIYG